MVFIQLTGLSGSGKTTVSQRVQKRLQQQGYAVEVLDGDEYRRQLWPELTYSVADRQENIRRLGYLGRVFNRHGIIVILAAINPNRAVREELHRLNQPVRTVFVDCALPTLIQRDTKGLYAKAALPDNHPDKVHNLTGINAPYEPPLTPDLTLHTDQESEADCAEKLLRFILLSLNEIAAQRLNQE